MRFGAFLLALLERHGVTHVFGIPGVHTAELYRGLPAARIRHITPRHEQGAGFMADGYARVTGRPGVCFVITGPGLTNIATAMGQAYQDSIPMLVISGVKPRPARPWPRATCTSCPTSTALAERLTAFSHTLLRAEDCPQVLARAFAVFTSARPRPVHIEIPIDVMEQSVDEGLLAALCGPPAAYQCLSRETIVAAAAMLEGAQAPVLLVVGGGARQRRAIDRDACRKARRAGRHDRECARPPALRPSARRAREPIAWRAVRQLIAEADVVLAIGTEIGPTDYDMYRRGGFSIPGRLIRDRDRPRADDRGCTADGRFSPLLGTPGATVDALSGSRRELGRRRSAPCQGAARGAFEELSPAVRRQVEFLGAIREALPGRGHRRRLHAGRLCRQPLLRGRAPAPAGSIPPPATARSAMRFPPPSAPSSARRSGRSSASPATAACSSRCGELGAAMDAGAPIIVLVWNNRGYGEIETYMKERGIEPEGVRLTTPDFVAIARAYGLAAERLPARGDLSRLLAEAAQRSIPTLIEIDEAVIMG